jgi:hypothetical protein
LLRMVLSITRMNQGRPRVLTRGYNKFDFAVPTVST